MKSVALLLWILGIYAFSRTTYGRLNTTYTSSRYHNLLVDLQQSFWKVSVELSALRGEMDTLRKANQKLTNEVRSYNHSLEVLEKQTKYLTVSLLEVWRTTELLNTSLSRQLQDRVDSHRRVGFTAGCGTRFLYGDSDLTDIIYRDVITNVGGGYNPESGKFTAPINGTYVFFTTVVSWHNQIILTDIVLNGKSQVRSYADSRGFITPKQYIYQTGTNLVVLQLQVGDKVWVRKYHGSGYIVHATPIHTFSGYLL